MLPEPSMILTQFPNEGFAGRVIVLEAAEESTTSLSPCDAVLFPMIAHHPPWSVV